MSNIDSVIDLTSSPANVQAQPAASPKLHKTSTLTGKSFVITGIWLTMSSEQAKELCRANGGYADLYIYMK